MDPLNNDQIKEELARLPGWKFEDDSIRKDFKFPDFKKALAFMVQVGFEAEKQGHHPDWTNVYNSVSIRLNTHDAGGKVTQKDIELAGAIENIAAG